jgi:flagellar motor switch protein FliM
VYKKRVRLVPDIEDWTRVRKDPDIPDKKDFIELLNKIPKGGINKGLRSGNIFIENFCQKLKTQIGLEVTPYQLEFKILEFQEYKEALARKNFIQIVLKYQGFGAVQFWIEPAFMQTIINRLTGGSQVSKEKSNDLTEIEEKAILVNILDEMQSSYALSWSNILTAPQTRKINPLVSKEEGAELEAEEYVIFSAKVALDKDPEMQNFQIVYPLKMFNFLAEKWPGIIKPKNQQVKLLPEACTGIKVQVKAFLGKTNVTMADVFGIQQGDVIQLAQPVDDLTKISVGEDADTELYGRSGVYNNRLSIQLLKAGEVRIASPVSPVEAFQRDQAEAEPAFAEQAEVKEISKPAEPAEIEDDVLDDIELDDDDDDDDDFSWDDDDLLDEDF